MFIETETFRDSFSPSSVTPLPFAQYSFSQTVDDRLWSRVYIYEKKLEDISRQERNLVHNEDRRPIWQWRHNIQLSKKRKISCNL
jgi:hypothetical protein